MATRLGKHQGDVLEQSRGDSLILTKERMYALLHKGAFGNFIQQWNSLAEIEQSGYRGLVSIRSRQVGNPVRLYHVPYAELAGRVATLPESQRNSGLVFSEAPPDDKRTIQGEVCRSSEGLVFEHTYVCLPMRLALQEQRLFAKGLQAKLLLQQHLAPVDYDELMDLLDRFDGAIVEISAFSVPVGILPHHYAIIWEVRHY